MSFVFWIAQGIGLIALGFSILAYQAKTREEILGRQMVGSFVYMLHFALLLAWTGVAMNAIVAARNWVFMKNDSEKWAKHIFWMHAFMFASLCALYFTWEGYISLLPGIAMLLGVYARWKGEPSSIRIYSLIGTLMWIPYTVAVSSYSGTLANVVISGAILYGILKHDRPLKAEKEFRSL